MINAPSGTVIHGTLRDEDLLKAFRNALHECIVRNPDLPQKHLEKATVLIWDAIEVKPETDTAAEIINDLIDALQEFAPPGHYFGTHEGDGSDFGFWEVPDDGTTP